MDKTLSKPGRFRNFPPKQDQKSVSQQEEVGSPDTSVFHRFGCDPQ